MNNSIKYSQFTKNLSKNWLPLFITILFSILVSYVTFVINDPKFDSDLLFYLYNGNEIIFENNYEIIIFNAPIGLPIILASLNYFIDDPFATGKILSIIFSSGIVFISYFVIKNLFNSKIAKIGQILFVINPILHVEAIFTHLEMLPIFLILLSLYFITKKELLPKHIVLCAIFLGFSFMIRYQSVSIFIGIVLILLLFNNKKKKSLFLFLLSFTIAISPLLLFNYSIHEVLVTSNPDFFLDHHSSLYDNKLETSSLKNEPTSNLLSLKNYFSNLFEINPHMLFNTGNGFNNISPISFIPYVGILLIVGGIMSGLSSISSYKREILLISIIFVVSYSFISIIPITNAVDMLFLLIIPIALTSFFIVNSIKKIFEKICNKDNRNYDKYEKILLISIIVIIIVINLTSSFMIEKNLIFGIPIDYKNILEKIDTSNPKSLKFYNVSSILLNESSISQKYIMANDLNYLHLVNSKFIYSTFEEGDPNDDVSTYLSRENWTKINHAESYISSFPKNEFDQANIMPDYIIFEDENDRLLHKILGNPNDPRLPSSFQLIYSSPDGKNLVYKINK